MKKIFTTLFALGAFFAASAQMSVTYNEQEVQPDTTLYCSVEFFEIPGVMTEWSSKPEINFTGEEGTYVKVSVTSTDCMTGALQMCFPTNCQNITEATPSRYGVAEATGNPQDLQLHFVAGSKDQAVMPATMQVNVSTYDDEDLESFIEELNFSIVFYDENSGVKDIAVNAAKVAISGNTLSFTGAKAGKLEIISLTGAKVLSKNVSGEGTVSLANMAPGIYLYRLGNTTGKFVRR